MGRGKKGRKMKEHERGGISGGEGRMRERGKEHEKRGMTGGERGGEK